MVWGTFGSVHLATLIFAALILVGLYRLLKNRSVKVQTMVLGALSFSGIGAIFFNLLTWGSPLEYLPLHLCSITAIMLPIAVFTRSKWLGNLLLLWCLGAVFALVVNTAQADFSLFSWTFAFYYFPHVLEFGIPILLVKLGLIEKDYKCIGSTLLITMIIFSVVHCANLWLNWYCREEQILDYAGNLIQVNYMFTVKPENPVLQLFYRIIPHSYWYLYLAIPIVAAYLGVIYIPEFSAKKAAVLRLPANYRIMRKQTGRR